MAGNEFYRPVGRHGGERRLSSHWILDEPPLRFNHLSLILRKSDFLIAPVFTGNRDETPRQRPKRS